MNNHDNTASENVSVHGWNSILGSFQAALVHCMHGLSRPKRNPHQKPGCAALFTTGGVLWIAMTNNICCFSNVILSQETKQSAKEFVCFDVVERAGFQSSIGRIFHVLLFHLFHSVIVPFIPFVPLYFICFYSI